MADCSFQHLENWMRYPLDTGRNFNVHKTLRRCPGRLIYLPFTSFVQGVVFFFKTNYRFKGECTKGNALRDQGGQGVNKKVEVQVTLEITNFLFKTFKETEEFPSIFTLTHFILLIFWFSVFRTYRQSPVSLNALTMKLTKI